jgi:transposase
VIEAEQPIRKTRRGNGKSDPIDAHLAVLYALQLDAERLPTPRADGYREALRILLGARQELTTTAIGQANRLRALLRDGDDTERQIARGALTEATLTRLARRRPPCETSRQQAVRHADIRRLAVTLREANRDLKANRTQLRAIVNDLAPA